MSTDNKTALQQSIQRKKDRLKLLEQYVENADREGFIPTSFPFEIDFLKDQIYEDEKLLPTDKEQWIDAFTLGQVSGYNADWENQEMDLPEDKWNEKYGSDE